MNFDDKNLKEMILSLTLQVNLLRGEIELLKMVVKKQPKEAKIQILTRENEILSKQVTELQDKIGEYVGQAYHFVNDFEDYRKV